MREKIGAARKMQEKRYAAPTTGSMEMSPSADAEKYCVLGTEEKKVMGQMYHTLALSARAYHRILKTARTIADLEGYGEITKDHLLEAACYRPSEEYWN